MCRRNSGQSRRKRRICSRILVCSPALRSTTIEEGTVIPPTTRDKLALSGVADRNCRCHSLLQCVRPITWFDLEGRTRRFVTAMRETTLPAPVKEAAMANLSTLVTTTCFRTADGEFHGFEGVNDRLNQT